MWNPLNSIKKIAHGLGEFVEGTTEIVLGGMVANTAREILTENHDDHKANHDDKHQGNLQYHENQQHESHDSFDAHTDSHMTDHNHFDGDHH